MCIRKGWDGGGVAILVEESDYTVLNEVQGGTGAPTSRIFSGYRHYYTEGYRHFRTDEQPIGLWARI